MSIAKSIVKISSSWGGIVVQKKNSLGQDKYYCVVDTVMFGGWSYTGKREDEYYFPYTENKFRQVINAKEKKYAKGSMFSVFLLDFVPDGFTKFESLLSKADMKKKELFEGSTVYGVKSTTAGVLGMRTPVSKIKYPIVRKGCISVICPSFDGNGDYPRYYVDIGFKTVDGGGIYYYIKEDNEDKLIGMSKDIITRGHGRDTIFYDLAQVTFIDEAIDLIKQVEKDTTKVEVEEGNYSIDQSDFETNKKNYEVDF